MDLERPRFRVVDISFIKSSSCLSRLVVGVRLLAGGERWILWAGFGAALLVFLLLQSERTRCRLEGGVNRRFKNNYGIDLMECGIKLTFIFFKHKT
jgi:hypothetical protein